MENSKIQHWKKNNFKWHESKQVEENKSMKQQFKRAMTRLKESVRFDLEDDDEYEESD